VNGPGNVAEALEDPLMIFGRDTNPGIRDADFRSAVGRGLCALTKGDDYGLATGREAPRVFKKDVEEALESEVVGIGPELESGQIEAEANPCIGKTLVPFLRNFAKKVGNVGRLKVKHLNTSVGARQCEQLVDNARHLN